MCQVKGELARGGGGFSEGKKEGEKEEEREERDVGERADHFLKGKEISSHTAELQYPIS